MFDMFKKLDEEQNNGEPSTEEQCENLEETIKEENASEEIITANEPCQNEEENILSMLETLEGEEKSLIAEKLQLINMEETLKQKIRDEIEVKRHKIENLRHEIPELKQRCEVLAKALEIPVQK
jgi:predicted RNase H-like nuclease (RuvC/YqgF family)